MPSSTSATTRPTASAVAAASRAGKTLVIGTTGHTRQQGFADHARREHPDRLRAELQRRREHALLALTQGAAEILGPDFDLEVVEMHHRLKKDAPSGTAKRLAEILAEVRRGGDALSTHSIRAGDIVGEHTVIFAGAGERLELTHRASSRESFAVGALRAARWVIEQPPGLYNMENVLGL